LQPVLPGGRMSGTRNCKCTHAVPLRPILQWTMLGFIYGVNGCGLLKTLECPDCVPLKPGLVTERGKKGNLSAIKI
jgi:hypothetical protein